MDLQYSRTHILRCLAGTPDQHRQTNRLYRRMCIGAAQCELSRNKENVFGRPATLASRARGGFVASATLYAPREPTFWYKGDDGLWQLGKISASTTADGVYLVRFLDDPGPIKHPLPPVRCTTSTGAVRGSRCLQVHVAITFPRVLQRNVDESRGAAVVS